MQQFGTFFLNHWDMFLALFVILGLLIFQTFGARLRGFLEVEPMEAVQLLNHEDALVLDVREDNEFKEGHLDGARHIPLGKLGGRFSELESHKAKAVVVACRSGHRSARACGMLRKQGFDKVYNLRGGMLAWQNAGLPVSREHKRKKK